MMNKRTQKDSVSANVTTRVMAANPAYYVFAAVAVLVLAYIVTRYREPAGYFLDILKNVDTDQETKRLPDFVVSKAITEPWPEPLSPETLFDNSTRILWGYWDKGEDELPGLCQLAVRSWRARHPNWRVVIVSQGNFKDYVAMKDLPSTFESLIVQHQSDIIRLALLIRYGGVYMDVSTVVLKGLDDIWNSIPPNRLLLTTPVLFSNGMTMANNALLLVPSRNNPVLREWQRRVLDYAENPVTTINELRRHPRFQRVAPLFDDPALGALKDMIPYCALLWLLNDLLYYDEKLRPFIMENVQSLPSRRWTFEFFSFPVLGKRSTVDPTRDPPIKSWSTSTLLYLTWLRTLDRFFDDPERAQLLFEQINVLKLSSVAKDFHLPMSELLELDSTVGRVYRAAVKEGPTMQATLNGATPIPNIA